MTSTTIGEILLHRLFQWNTLEYAFENKSFVSVEMILKRCEYQKKELHQYVHQKIYQ
jgi:hypothetical protein